jgi:hypothetical protein
MEIIEKNERNRKWIWRRDIKEPDIQIWRRIGKTWALGALV